MENVQMLGQMDPQTFWKQLKTIVEHAVQENSLSGSVDKYAQKLLLKSKAIPEILHISKPSLCDWLQKGKIKSVKIESHRYFLWKDVEQLIQEIQVNPSTILP